MWHGLVITCVFGILAAGLYTLALALAGEIHSLVPALLISSVIVWLGWGVTGGKRR